MATRAKELSDLGNLKLDVTANGIDVVGVGSNFKSESYNILNVQTDTNDNGSSDDGIFKITNGSAGTTKAEFRWDESEDLVHVSYGDHGRHISIGSDGNVGISTGSTAPVSTLDVSSTNAIGSVFRKDFNGPVADTFSKLAVTLWGQDHDDADVGTGTDQFGPMLGFGARIDDGNPNSGDVRAGISYSYNGDLTFHAKAGASVADGSHERIRIDGATGNVGIGEISPDYQLHVSGAGDIKIEDTAGGSAHLHIASSTSGLRDSEWRLKTSGNDDEFTFDHRYTANDGSNDVVGNGTVLTLKSDANVDVTNNLVANNAKLKAIAKDISTTPVDAFIYDTRKDSDGGAWRHRTQNTSWYNETLNTATRGSRKEFPAVAVITLNSGEIIIYDGDDPDVPMWMKFTQSTGQSFTENGQSSYVVGGCGFATTSGITMLNGTLVVPHHGGCGSGDTREGILSLNFLSEVGEWITDSSAANFNFAGPISNRNTNMRLLLKQSTRTILDSEVNDVAMTVLPNAPIDNATGLPIPTIGVASEEGVSVIKDDGTIVDITHTASVHKGAKHISFNGSQVSYATQQSGSGTTFWRKVYINIPDSDITAAYASSIANNTSYDARGTTGNKPALNGDNDLGDITNDIVDSVHDKAFAFSNKLTLLHVEQFSKGNLPIDSSVAYIASNYNTGWMNGDVKLATLSDTNATNLSGTNRCAADDFSSGWTVTSGSNMSIGSNVLSVVDTSNVGSTFCDQTITTIVGQEYVIDVTATGTSGTGIGLYVGSYGGPVEGYQWEPTYSFTANATTTTIRLYRFEGHTGSGTISSVIIKEASADHSFAMANGRSSLSAFGTITKTPVATGAELVSYSGWSGSNYLQAELDWTIGTSDFTFSFWANPPASPGGYCHVISIGTESTGGQTSGGGIVLKLNAADGSAPYFYTGAGGASQSSYDSTNRLAALEWNQVICGRNNGVFYIYINGELAQTGSSNSFDISDQVLMIGRGAGQNEFVPDTKLALVRVSKTGPTVEQIKKSYNDEKMLFQENAKATLYGTSDSVKALAHDDDTELLHVGTSAGRSVFQGLRRIDNTTTAVAKYIKASNGMVAEE